MKSIKIQTFILTLLVACMFNCKENKTADSETSTFMDANKKSMAGNTFNNPLLESGADPWTIDGSIFRHNDQLYFIWKPSGKTNQH